MRAGGGLNALRTRSKVETSITKKTQEVGGPFVAVLEAKINWGRTVGV